MPLLAEMTRLLLATLLAVFMIEVLTAGSIAVINIDEENTAGDDTVSSSEGIASDNTVSKNEEESIAYGDTVSNCDECAADYVTVSHCDE